jgi:hypothetical protein
MDKKVFTTIKNAISDWAYPNFFIYEKLGKETVTGIFCTCSLFVTKNKSIERTKKVIEDNKLPYTVSELGMENTKHFEIRFQ